MNHIAFEVMFGFIWLLTIIWIVGNVLVICGILRIPTGD